MEFRSRKRLSPRMARRVRAGRPGFSLVEMLVVIGVIAIMAAIGIPMIANTVSSSAHRTADRNMKLLNGAVISFGQENWELVLAESGGSDDELAIFESLRYRDATNPAPGSPYLPQNATFVASGDTSTYRAVWNGRMFELVPAGTAGTGLDLLNIMGAVQAPPTGTPVPPATNQ
jgi:prepilin-type N-terminal cleavage/methylation domain-containing protein